MKSMHIVLAAAESIMSLKYIRKFERCIESNALEEKKLMAQR